MTTPAPLLSVRDLRTRFDLSSGVLTPVDSVSLDVYPGEAVGLVGESGSGKSLTARSVMRMVPRPGEVVGGQILYGGEDLATLSQRAMERIRGRRIGMVFQDASTFLNPVLTVGYQIAEGIRRHFGPDGVDRRVDELLDMVGLPQAHGVARRYPHELSGGMRQRVLLAIALACGPELLIADEPTTALDVTIQAQILDLIDQLRTELGLAVLLISHDLGVVAEVCERVYVMYAGRIVESAASSDFFATAAHPYSQGLLRSAASLEEGMGGLYSIGGSVPDLSSPPPGCRFHPRCPIADETACRTEVPELRSLGPGRLVACHHAEETPAGGLAPPGGQHDDTPTQGGR